MGLFGKKQSTGFGQSKTLVTPEGLSEGSISWESVARSAVAFQAAAWFEQYKPCHTREALPPGALDADKTMSHFFGALAGFLDGEDSPLMIPDLEISTSDLGEEVDLTQSELGKAIIATLKSAGVTWKYETLFPISHTESVELPEDRTTGVSQWGTYFGLPIEQMFRVFRNDKGEETCLWSSNMLAATRPFEHLTWREVRAYDTGELMVATLSEESVSKGALTFGQWSTKIFIPQFATRLFFMAETPFPSNVLMTWGRNIAFGDDVPAEKYPRPVLINKQQSYARGAFGEEQGSFLASGTIMPHVVEMGWTFSTTDQTQIQKILEVITTGLTRIATILEDGYLNYRTNDFSFPFDDVLLSATKFDVDTVPGEEALALSFWVPVVRLGILLNETNARSHVAVNQNDVDEQYWVSLNGAGAFVPNAVNSLVYSTLIAEQEWFTIDRLLDASVRMNVMNESTNSLTNWGIAKFKQGLVDEAIEKFELALARPDKYSEAEASYWLAEIWEQQGDATKAQAFRERCQTAGGYVPDSGFSPSGGPASPAAQSSGELSKSSGGGLGGGGLGTPSASVSGPASSGNLAAFCRQCGTKFENDTAKFCGNCGSPR